MRELGVRRLPRNEEAECQVLGAAMLEPEEVLPFLVERLTPDHFYLPAHRLIFQTLVDLFQQNKHADTVAVGNRLEEKGQLDKVGGRTYLAGLLDAVATSAAVEHYVGILEEKALRRWLIAAGAKVSELGYSEDLPTDSALDQAEEEVFKIASRRYSPRYHRLRDFLEQHVNLLIEIHKDPKRRPVGALSTGFDQFDAYTGGLRPAEFIVIAGRPGTGKTSLALNILRSAALDQGKKVGLFSLEMTKEQILEKLIASEAQVDLKQLRHGYLSPAKLGLVAEAVAKFEDAQVFVDDSSTLSVLSMKAKARQMAKECGGLDLIIVDYLQLVDAGIKTDVREQQIAYVSRSLKALAKELNVPLIACSQLNRAVERRENRRPMLSDLRESGAIEQDADLVVLIHRQDPAEAQASPGEALEVELIIAKQRNGPTGQFALMFHRNSATFYPEEKFGPKEPVPF